MKRLVLQIYDYLSSHKVVAAALWTALLVLCGVSVYRLDFEENISAFLPRSPESERYNEAYARLGQEKMAVLFEGGQLEDRLDAMAAFESRWAQADTAGLVPDLRASADENRMLEVLSFLTANVPYFLEESDYARMDSLLAHPGYPEECLAGARENLYSAASGLTSRYLRSDPLNLFTPMLQRLRSMNPSGNSRLEDGCLFTEDGSVGVIFFDSPFGGSESGRNAALIRTLDEAKTMAMADCPAVTITSTGGPEVAVGNASRIKKDSFLALALAAVLIFIVLWLSYKRLSDVLWILISIATGALFALGIISLFKTSISIIILGIGSTIIGIAVNYPLHYVDHLKYQKDKRKALAEQVNPLLVGNITTVGAFLSMLLLKAGALRDFGFIGAMMLVGTILFVLVFLPVFVPAASRPRKTLQLDLDRHITLPRKARGWVFLGFLLVSAVLWQLGRGVGFDADMHHINYMTPEQERGFSILSSFASSREGTLYVVAEGADADEALQRAAALPGREKMTSLVPFVPSRQLQQERLQRWNAFVGRHPDLLHTVDAAAAAQGFTPQAFLPFHALVEGEWPLRPVSYFAPLTRTLGAALLDEEEGRCQVVSLLKTAPGETEAVKEALRAALPEGTFCFDSKDLTSSLVSLLSDDFDRIGLLCSLIVFFFLWLSFHSLELSLISFLPLAAGWIWILGTMRIFGLQFNIVNIILATFIFGQGDDYTIFITEGLMYEYATGRKILRSYKNAVVLSALIMFIGIGALIVSRHPAMRSLAEVTFIGMFTVVVMAYYLPPLVFRFLTERKGELRRTALTIKNFLCTVYIFAVFLVSMLVLTMRVWLLFLGKVDERKREHYHRILQRISKAALRLIPGCPYTLSNPSGVTFDKPSVMLCNHQSHLDVLAILALTPKVVLMTNDWVWHSPFYGYLVRKAEFIPASEGLEKNMDRIREMLSRGYSVAIFPEGTRSMDCSVQRFHRGAFLVARTLQADIQPLLIHGFGYALPKHDFLLRKAALHMEVGPRIPWTEVGEDLAAYTREIRHWYQREYASLRRRLETASYVAPFVADRYLYRGHDSALECRRILKKETCAAVDALPPGELTVREAGCGVYPLLVALARPDIRVTAYEADEEKYLTAIRLPRLPENLTYIHGTAL